MESNFFILQNWQFKAASPMQILPFLLYIIPFYSAKADFLKSEGLIFS